MVSNGDYYESPAGLGFTVKSVTKKAITVEVDRVVRRNSKQAVETNTRVVPTELWATFARAYKKAKK